MKGIKIICFVLIFQFSIVGVGFSKNVLDYLTEVVSMNNQNVTCPSCHFVNKPGASFCAGCGKSIAFLSQKNIQCPYCRKQFYFSPSYKVSFCSACGARASEGAVFCSACGASLHLLECPACGREIKNIKQTSVHRERRERKQEELRQPTDQSLIKLSEFIKKDNGRYKQHYDVSAYTSNRSFSKIIMDQSGGEGYGVIVNTIKVGDRNHWAVTPATTRLKNGRNEFQVAIPKGTKLLSISYNHGRSSKVIIYIQ